MALPVVRCCLQRVFAQSPSHISSRIVQYPAVVPCFTNLLVPSRKYAANLMYQIRICSVESDNVDFYFFSLLYFQKSVGPFISTLLLPYRFTDTIPKILVFTQDSKEADLAIENGATIVGGIELIKPILNEEIEADFYIAVPDITTKINPLRNFLKQKYPSIKNGTITYNIPETLNFFKVCHEYEVTNDNLIQTPFAMLDMPNDEILANLDSIIKDICKRKTSKHGSFVTSMRVRSSTSEALDVKFEQFLPEEALEQKSEEAERISEEEKQEPDD
ncbi:large ribosomal subunit protein uL1m [Ahaetulla prasina]|uniref:large ribosomal subunit protein uL1m n=1 Tax=Ahaetulla prasina TaxID=499056 RepID=UPI0026478948|nr:large ribosomal subunit protein uL1m [Ahaetulla prasina]